MRRVIWVVLFAGACFAQHEHHMEMPPAKPKPVLKGAALTLEALEQMALEHNPRIAGAKASVDAAAGAVAQAGLWPNPSLGVTGDHVTPVTNGGSIGGFVEQRFVMGGKLSLARQVADREKAEMQQSAEGERLRVLTMVRLLYIEALGEQALLEARTEIASVAKRTAEIARELANIGQADSPDVLAAENEAERLEIDVEAARHGIERAMRQLAAVVNVRVLEGHVEGKLEDVPKVDADAALARITNESPELKAASIEIERAKVAVRRAQNARIPDLIFRGGLRSNREYGFSGGPVGTEGIFDVSVELPVFNRNQGAIASAKAEAERARAMAERVKLDVRSRLAMAVQEYEDASVAAERYRTRILPKARQALEQHSASFQKMATAYPLVLGAQRNLAQYQDAYVQALMNARKAAAEVEGMLLR